MPWTKEGLKRLVARTGVSERVTAAFGSVDRAAFVPSDLTGEAYGDRPVPLPESQTTSQPTLIALMIDALELTPNDRVLEVGAGYGYQTALLATLAREVVGIERHASLARSAAGNLEGAGITNAVVVAGDGWQGAPESAPFDAIVVSAAAARMPEALPEQLTEGGRLVIPLRERGSDDVWVFRKERGELRRVRLISPARFVPLVEEQGEVGL